MRENYICNYIDPALFNDLKTAKVLAKKQRTQKQTAITLKKQFPKLTNKEIDALAMVGAYEHTLFEIQKEKGKLWVLQSTYFCKRSRPQKQVREFLVMNATSDFKLPYLMGHFKKGELRKLPINRQASEVPFVMSFLDTAFKGIKLSKKAQEIFKALKSNDLDSLVGDIDIHKVRDVLWDKESPLSLFAQSPLNQLDIDFWQTGTHDQAWRFKVTKSTD